MGRIRFAEQLGAIALFTALGSSAAAGADNGSQVFEGVLAMYEPAETYSSILGGKAVLLQPTGYDEFYDTKPGVLISGVISNETVHNLANILARSRVSVVYFDSPGGDLLAGIEMGALIHALGLSTAVSWTGECESACALAFLGGKIRFEVGDLSRFGFHRQYYIRKGEIQYGSWARDRKQIQDYFDMINFHGLDAAEVVSTTGLVTFSETALARRGITQWGRNSVISGFGQVLDDTGISYYEAVRVRCGRFASTPIPTTKEQWDIYGFTAVLAKMDCQSMQPANREPLLTRAVKVPDSETQEASADIIASAYQWLSKHGFDYQALNEKDGDRYQKYLRNRKAFIETMNAPGDHPAASKEEATSSAAAVAPP